MSLDEAYLDLSGTERMHGMRPAKTMAALALRDRTRGRHHRFHRPVGQQVPGQAGQSELDKPRGFAVIGMAEAKCFLRDKPVGIIRGAGKVLQARLERDGIATIGQLQDADPARAGRALWRDRPVAGAAWPMPRIAAPVDPGGEMKTISSETTFNKDLSRLCANWKACCGGRPNGSRARAKAKGLAGQHHRAETQDRRFPAAHPHAPRWMRPPSWPTASSASRRRALKREADGTRFRLLGVGLSNLTPADERRSRAA